MKPSHSLFLVLFMSLCSLSYGQEICHNGIDDDGDGYIDMFDTDCYCYNEQAAPSSLILNASFEEMAAAPTQTGQLDLATGWKQATAGTTDYFNGDYKLGAASQLGLKASHGTGYAGALYTAGWKEYLGTCLSSPLEAGKTYQITMDVAMLTIDADGNACGDGSGLEPVEVTIYGNKHCSSLPQPNNLGCPTGDDTQTSTQGDPSWFVLGYALYEPTADWEKITVTFTPAISADAIMIGAPCTLPASFSKDMNCSPYMLYDHLVLNTYSSFFGKLDAPKVEAQKTVDCDGTHYTLATETVEGAVQYWIDPAQKIHEGDTYSFDASTATGVYGTYYIIHSCTSEVAYIDPFADAYVVGAMKDMVLPNIITPNGDGINDELNAEEIVMGCLPFEMNLVDRWGGLVYKQTNGQPGFSGKNQFGANVNDGVYFYSISYQGEYFKGSLTVVR